MLTTFLVHFCSVVFFLHNYETSLLVIILLQEFPIDDNYCGTYDINTPINGPEPITAEAGTILNASASSIAVSITHRYTVAFIGTTHGHIKKVSNGDNCHHHYTIMDNFIIKLSYSTYYALDIFSKN